MEITLTPVDLSNRDEQIIAAFLDSDRGLGGNKEPDDA
jgi:hypothetical protein